MGDIFIHKLSSNWPLKVFLEPLNHEKHLCNKIDQICETKIDRKIERRYSQIKCQQTWEISRKKVHLSSNVYKLWKTYTKPKNLTQRQSNGEPSRQFLANSNYIFINFSRGQWLSTFLFSDLNSGYKRDFNLNWLR